MNLSELQEDEYPFFYSTYIKVLNTVKLIEDYYDAVYDTTYKKEMLDQLPKHHPDDVYPRWGSAGWQVDPFSPPLCKACPGG